MNWYYAKNGAQEGPVTTEALRAKIDSGEVAPTDLAWREGLADWLPVSKIPEFAGPEAPSSVPAVPVIPGTVPAASPYETPVSAPAGYQQPYPQQGGFPVARSSGMAIGALICGILGFLICCAPYIALPLALVGIVLGHIAASKAKSDPARFGGRGMAITGLVFGYLGLIVALVFGFFTLQLISKTKNMSDAEKQEYIESGDWLPLPEGSRQQFREQMKAQREKQQQLQNAPKESP